MTEPRTPELECVDSPVGERIPELSRPGLEPEERKLLEAHLEVCAHCRQVVDLDQRLSAAMRRGPSRTVRRGRPFWLGSASLAAAAAAAFCMMTMTPRPTGPETSMRGPDDARFVRPVEGEVVLPTDLSVRWTEVQGADSYEVTLSDIDGTDEWTGTAQTTSWRAGDDVDLVSGHNYRLILRTVPADLVPPGDASVRFTAGTVPALVSHRVTRAQPIAYGLLFSAFTLGVYAISARKRRV